MVINKKATKKETLFAKSVSKVVAAGIPKGETLSYGEVARLAGFPGAGRAVGSLMKNNFDKNIPCHRVIRSDGRAGHYNRGGEETKIKLLRKEGAKI